MNNKTIALPETCFDGSIKTFSIPGEGSRINLLLKILCLIGFGAITAAGKKISIPLGIPGHSCVLWLGVMIGGRALFQNNGIGAIIGAGTALWGIPIGLEHSFLHNLGLYGTTGLALDLATKLPFLDIRKFGGAVVAGMLAHLVKFSFLLGIVFTSSVTKHFLIIGLGKSAILHLIFGAAAGVTGTLIIKGCLALQSTFFNKGSIFFPPQ